MNVPPALETVRLLLLLLLCAAVAMAQTPASHPASQPTSHPTTQATTQPVRAPRNARIPIVDAMNLSGGMEGGDPCVFLVSRSGRTDLDMVVYCTPVGTATEGADYPFVARQLTIPRGFRTATLILPLLNDGEEEVSETIGLTLRPSPFAATRPAAGAAPATRPTTRRAGDVLPRP